MKKNLCLTIMTCFLLGNAWAQAQLDVEAGYVLPGYIDVAIPGDAGTRFSLTDDLEAERTLSFRMRYGHALAKNHWVGLLVAPLTVGSEGRLARDINFNGVIFPAATSVGSVFRFNSYRLIYRYLVHQGERYRFCFGAAAKVRDASIRLEGGGMESEKTNVGLVPLLSFELGWAPFNRFALVADGEALVAPQGRAEDILFAARYDISPSMALNIGYRILEGGSDTDEVYTFALFHYIVAGLACRF